jgi:HK97 family phage prohead protease
MRMTERRAEKLLGAPERRSLAVDDFEFRQQGDTLTLSGYASVFDAAYDVYGGPDKGGWSEIVDRRAFDVTLKEKPDVHLLINHEGMPLARTKSGTLQLATDDVGLRVNANLDRRDPDVQRLQTKMDRGDMDEMSFAFRTIRHAWNDDETERRMLEVSIHKGDVSVVNFGANPATSSQLRSVLAELADIDAGEVLAEVRSLDRDVLTEAYKTLGQVLRETRPPEKQTLSLVEARKLLEV